jgi:hypothetical protein
MGVGGQRHAPAALSPRKTRYPLYRRLGGLQGQCGRVWKISPPRGIRFPGRPVRSESLYRLGYPGSHRRVVVPSSLGLSSARRIQPQRHSPEELNFQQHRSEIFKCCITQRNADTWTFTCMYTVSVDVYLFTT